MGKYMVFKKVVAHELIMVEAETPNAAIENVMNSALTTFSPRLQWVEDCDPNFWGVEPLVATDEELQALRHSARRLPDVFTGSDSPLGDDEC